MANEVLIKSGTVIKVGESSYAGSLGVTIESTDPKIGLAGLADGDMHQSEKIDFEATRAARHALFAELQFASAPTSGLTVDIYLAASPNSESSVANPGGAVGGDCSYTGTPGDSMDDSLAQLEFIGSFRCTSDTIAQRQFVGTVSMNHRYGILVVDNNSGQAMFADAEEMILHMTPVIDEVQA